MKRLIRFSIILVLLLGYLPQSTAFAVLTPLRQQLPGEGNNVGSNLKIQCADNVTVMNTNDSGEGSLRQAIINVCPGRSIIFDASLSGTITLFGHIRINKSLTIVGLGADVLTISGNEVPHYSFVNEGDDVGGVFWLQGEYAPDVQPITVNISGLTIQDGRAREGGAIYNHSRSTLVLSDCVIGPNNQAIESGGGISNKYGSVTLNRCTIWGNSQIAQSGYYELPGGGGILTYNSPASTTLINSTVSGNHADTYGGGILALQSGVVNIIHTTVSLNSAGVETVTNSGGGVLNNSGTVNIRNSIVAGNLDESPGANPDVSGAITSQGGNLIGDPTGSTNLWAGTDKVGTAETPLDPKLGALFKNDPGRTLTHALLSGSPAIDWSACLPEVPFDQRGVIRPSSGNTCAIGAYEVGLTNGPLTVLPESIPAGEFGSAYIQHFTVIGTNKAVNWTWTPVGSILDPSCDFNFPNVGGILCYLGDDYLLPIGSYTFTVNAKEEDGGTLTGSRDYTLVIKPRLDFTPITLLKTRVSSVYNQVVTVSGGEAPYEITHLSGSLPAGITFDEGTDSLSGTPTVAGTYPYIVIQAVDKNGITKTKTYTLTVLPEHLFSWTPETPTSYQTTTFTAVSGFDYYDWSWSSEPDGECDDPGYSSYGNPKLITFYGRGEHKVCLTLGNVSPPYGEFTDQQFVTVTNYPPAISRLQVYPISSFPGQQVEMEAEVSDPDKDDTLACKIDWGDGTIEAGTYQAEDYVCAFPLHIYAIPGSYSIEVKVTDDQGAFDTETMTHQVVYLYAEQADIWLTSNILPTTITLYGYAPLGTESITFNIVPDPAPAHGMLGTPAFLDCIPDDYRPAAECRATVVYIPTVSDPLYVGDDRFTFTVSKDGHTSEPAIVNLWVDANIAPTSSDGTYTVLTNKASQISIFGSDVDEHQYVVDMLSFHIDVPPSSGRLSFYEDADVYDWLYPGATWYQKLIYTPNPGTTAGSDSFTFHVNDSHQNSEPATVTLTLYTPKTLTVTSNNDMVDGQGCDLTHCSLREAVLDSQIGDTIDFSLTLPNTISLTQGEILINENIQIEGPGADQLTISGGFTDPALPPNPASGFRVFHIFDEYWPVEVTISGLTIRNGRSDKGGGILVDEVAVLNLSDSVIGPNNIVSYAGGGIAANNATLTMNNCSVVGNHGTGSEGGAGIFARHTELTIINSTISGNVTNNYGGGILARQFALVTLIHSTVSGNTANQNYEIEAWGGGGGIYSENSEVKLWNTIVADNTDLTDLSQHVKWPDVYGAVTSLGGNLIGDGSGSTGWRAESEDLVGSAGDAINPHFESFGVHNPGHTPTYSLQPFSLAVDKVTCAAGVTTDQRSVSRPQGTNCDIGAYELEQQASSYDIFLPMIRR